MKFRTRDGRTVVEVIRLGLTSDNRDGAVFRVTRDGYLLGEARSVEELESYGHLADLEEAD